MWSALAVRQKQRTAKAKKIFLFIVWIRGERTGTLGFFAGMEWVYYEYTVYLGKSCVTPSP
jgi:hypothetical protein